LGHFKIWPKTNCPVVMKHNNVVKSANYGCTEYVMFVNKKVNILFDFNGKIILNKDALLNNTAVNCF